MPVQSDIVITGVGMATSLGFDAVTSCAAARAGITRPETLDYWVEDKDAIEAVPVVGRTMGWYTEGFSELGRLVQIARPAVRDVVRTAGLDANTLSRTAWIVNLSDGYHETAALRVEVETVPEEARESSRPPYQDLWPWYEERFMPTVLGDLSSVSAQSAVKLLYKGAAGAAVALAEARRVLGEGRIQACVVGGVDSLIDLRWLDAFHTLGLLKTPVDPAGLTPGEAGAFLCLETARAAEARGAKILARLGEPTIARDPAHRYHETPPMGSVLSSVILAALGAATSPVCYAGITGDAVGAGEWGRALVRMQSKLQFSDIEYPATSFGATGAASGFVSAGLALHAFARSTSASGTALVWDASDDGLRGAFTLTSPS